MRNYLVKHGTITHGIQFIDESRRREPLSYYSPETGCGRAIDYYRRALGTKPMRIGVVGLGTGTVAAYANRGDSVTFYEINSDVVKLTESGRWFTYLKDCRERGARCDVRLGDARLTLQRELDRNSPRFGRERLSTASPPLSGEGFAEGEPAGQNYHVIVLDAFSGDSVPAHLLTVEAFKLYLARLTHATTGDEEGAILVHISNRYLNLAPLVYGIRQHLQLGAVHIENENDDEKRVYSSNWVILSRNNELLTDLAKYASHADKDPIVIWTDSHSSLFDLLK
jgi:hypothetical protein